jgi:AhpD family alkylhydroperoxidase
MEREMGSALNDFREFRGRMNQRLLEEDNLILKRIFNLDAQAYQDSALPAKVKEMLGLVASMVLRCDDCIKYHLETSYQQGLSRQELLEIFAIANLVGGTIVIPHTRRALAFWDELENESHGNR